MNVPTACIRLVAASFAVLFSLMAADAAAVRAEHIDLELISESGVLVPGEIAWLGLHLRHDPHWHSYWTNPGDSGLPTRLKWDLPEGYSAGDIIWPAPSRFEISGLYNFGYDNETVLPVAIRVPESAIPGEMATLSVEARWLVCREECITGKATLQLEQPIATDKGSSNNASAKLFSDARAATPKPANWTGKAVMNGDRVEIRLDGAGLPEVEGLDVFAVERRILGNAPVDIRKAGDGLVIVAKKNDYFDQAPATLDLVLTSGMTNGRSSAWQLGVPFVVEESAD